MDATDTVTTRVGSRVSDVERVAVGTDGDVPATTGWTEIGGDVPITVLVLVSITVTVFPRRRSRRRGRRPG